VVSVRIGTPVLLRTSIEHDQQLRRTGVVMKAPPPASAPGPKVGPTVLVIDDDDVGRALLCEALRDVSKRTIELSTPIGATRTLVRENVDVVVLDLEMPNLRGDMLAKLFRSNARIAHVGVILVSGCGTEELEELGKKCGADDVVSKRFVRASLAVAVRNTWLVSRARMPKPTAARRGEEPAEDAPVVAAARPGPSPAKGR
jgi:DNA-binding response OmpR family regulator